MAAAKAYTPFKMENSLNTDVSYLNATMEIA
jgi:hypothetical protein